MVRTVSGPPGRGTGSSDPASPAARPAPRGPSPGERSGARQRAALFIRRYRLTPYALLLPSAVAIGLLLFWPTIQIAEFSLQNYGLPQVTGVAPTQWVGGANFSVDPVRPGVLAVAADQPDLRGRGGAADAADRHSGRAAPQPSRPEDVRVRVERGHAGLGHARRVGERHLHLADRPRRRDRRLGAGPAAVLGGRGRPLGRLQLDELRAARLHLADRARGLAGLPFRRRHRARRAEDHTGRAARIRPGGRRRGVADLLADHLPAAQADLPGLAAAVDHLGLRRVHPGVPGHRGTR